MEQTAVSVGDDLATLGRPSIEFLILADRAEAINGKLYVMGGAWDRIFVQDFNQPALISCAVGILVPWQATNVQHELRITIEDLDRHGPIGFDVRAGFVTGRPPWATRPETQRALIAVPTAPVLFPGPGTYQAVARITGGFIGEGEMPERRVEFQMIPIQAVQPMGPPMAPPAGPPG